MGGWKDELQLSLQKWVKLQKWMIDGQMDEKVVFNRRRTGWKKNAGWMEG